MFSRDKLGAAAREIADHLQIVDHVKALQDGQKALADGLAKLGDRIRILEQDMAVLRAETKLEALKEAQGVVFAVQGGLSQRIEDLAVQVAVFGATGIAPAATPRVRTDPARLGLGERSQAAHGEAPQVT